MNFEVNFDNRWIYYLTSVFPQIWINYSVKSIFGQSVGSDESDTLYDETSTLGLFIALYIFYGLLSIYLERVSIF